MKKQYKATIELWLTIESEEDLNDDKAKVESVIEHDLVSHGYKFWKKYDATYDVIKIESDPIQ